MSTFINGHKNLLIRLFCVLLLCLLPATVYAAEVTLSWEPPNDSRVVGYNIYCTTLGTNFSATPDQRINSANQTNCTISGLIPEETYKFAASSFDSNDRESELSETITYAVPAYSTFPDDIDDDGDGFTENDGDCNDSDANVFPGAIEICGDGIDQDCSGADLSCDSIVETHSVIFGNTPDADYNGTVQDTFININENVNISATQLNTYTWPENMPANAVLLKFDLFQLPADAQIQSATLTLYQTEAGGDTAYDVSAHKIINYNPDLSQASGYTYDGANDWTANNDCYNSVPLAQADIAAAGKVNRLDQNPGYKNWAVTGMVQDWVNDPGTNFGLLLNSDSAATSDSYRFFASSEANDSTQRPSLEVTYTTNSSLDVDGDGDGYTKNQGDCNDADASIHPGATETCGDGIDQNCDGADLTCPEDIDDDGDGYTENQGDCNDTDASIHPDAAEICGDGIDQDCNGSDEICPEDIDNDGDGYTENQGDCNDSDSSVYPGAEEVCGDGIDQDCNGSDLQCDRPWWWWWFYG